MCILCIELSKGKMTTHEGLRAVRELSDKDPHTKEILEFLLEEVYNEEIERNVGGMHQAFDNESLKEASIYETMDERDFHDFWYNEDPLLRSEQYYEPYYY